ncbi:MAG TPA: IS1 family transposase [Saprospiraceae bacterium]|nr:IS1 family transposase [Saprospiraceae bacterium]
MEVVTAAGHHGLDFDELDAERDDMWSDGGHKGNQSGLWHARDRETRQGVAYVLGARQDQVFLDLKGLLAPGGSSRFYTDGWGAYERNLDPEPPIIGTNNTQRIERNPLTVRTRIKRLARKTICFSKKEQMHDIVIGFFVNRYECGLAV